MGLGGENGGGKNKDRDKTKTNMVFKNLRKKIFKKYSFYIIILKWDLLLIFLLYFLYSFPVKVRITHSPLSYNADPFFSRRDGNYSDPYFREFGKMHAIFFKNRGVWEGGNYSDPIFFLGSKISRGNYSDEWLILAFMIL